jgi:hypothetical protein
VCLGWAGMATCLACGPAGTLEGELRAETPAIMGELGEQDPEEMEMPPPKPTCVTPSLTAIRTEVFVPECGACHSGATPAQSLDLTLDETSLRMRLMQPASQSPSGLPLVMPGSTGSSYLYLKIAVRTPLIGDRMPRNDDPLADCTLEGVRQWIVGGAN